MNCSVPEYHQRPHWLCLSPNTKTQQMKKNEYVNTSSFNHHPSHVKNVIPRPTCKNNNERSPFRYQCINKDVSVINDYIRSTNGNITESKNMLCNSSNPSHFHSLKKVYAPLSSSSRTNETNKCNKDKSLYFETTVNFRDKEQRLNLSKIESLSPEFKNTKVSCEEHSRVTNCNVLGIYREDIVTSLTSNITPRSKIIQENEITINTVPIKGILKSNSQSSYSSIENENGSDGDAPISIQSSPLESKSAKSSFKKKVHFEDHTITNIIKPFESYRDGVLNDPSELLATKEMIIHSNSNSTDESDRQSQHSYELYANYSNKAYYKTLNGVIHDKSRANKIFANFKMEKCDSQTSLSDFIYFAEAFQTDHESRKSQNHFQSQNGIQTYSKCKKNNSGTNEHNLGKECILKDQEHRAAYCLLPSSKSTNFCLLANEDKTGLNMFELMNDKSESDDKDVLSECSKQNQLINYPRSKHIIPSPSQNSAHDEKTQRILEWLDEVNAMGNPISNSMPLLVIPRPTLRRQSFVGE